MQEHKRFLRMGVAVLTLAVTLRLFGAGYFAPVGAFFQSPGMLSFLVYLQTGRVVRYGAPPSASPAPAEPMTPPLQPEQLPSLETQASRPVFSEADVQGLDVLYRCDYRPTLQPLMTKPLEWNLKNGAPAVLIIHTHATESYEKQSWEVYMEDVPYRTLNNGYNMVSVGDEVERVLTEGGISVLHDHTLHDYPSYNDAYENARVTIEKYLQEYPSIQMVLDIHRDASDGANGKQLTTYAEVGGQPSSQLLVMIGTDEMGNYHPNWRDNLAVGLKLSTVLERQNPGITRPITIRGERFNMDLTPASLLIEVGAAGDTHEQAMLAANALAQGILALAQGSALQ